MSDRRRRKLGSVNRVAELSDFGSLTKDRHKIFDVVRQIDGHLAVSSVLPEFTNDIDLLAQLLEIVLLNLFLSKNAHDGALGNFLSIRASLAAIQHFSPYVPQVAVFSGLPSWLVGLLDVQASLERVAMRNLRAAVYGRLILVSDRSG